MTASAGFSNLKVSKSNCLNNVTPKMIAQIQKIKFTTFLFSMIFSVLKVCELSFLLQIQKIINNEDRKE
ncbi:hypothetical protein D3C85_1712250 [compost metagenome]